MSRSMVCGNEMETSKKINNIKEGYMFVQGNVVWKPWSMKARYFILTSECLYCFKRRGDLDSIPSDVIKLDGISVTVDEERRGVRKRYYIRLNSTRQRKSFNLFCFMLEERNAWLTSILSALAKKYTDKGYRKQYHRVGSKTMSLFDESRKDFINRNIEESRAMSISCMELTNLSLLQEPMNQAQTATTIRKKFDFSVIHEHQKKMSSGSLDLAFRTDMATKQKQRTESLTADLSQTRKTEISLDTREYYRTLNRKKPDETSTNKLKSNTATNRTSVKRVKSMSDILKHDGVNPIFIMDVNDASSCQSTPSQKRKRNSLSFGGMFGNNLNFRTVSMANIF